ncbi:hypothetical protein EYF80_025915 [Scomber scombrus]|uniref:Uncharacterized protein n=1 Tax=Scomber scombrus TaxID=13677 RepID=A0AAV1ND28_SCOSC
MTENIPLIFGGLVNHQKRPIGEYLQLKAGPAVELPPPQDPFEVPEIRRRPPLQPPFNLSQPLIQPHRRLRHRSVQSVKVIDRHPWQKKTNLVPSEPDVVASVGLDHQNPMRPSTVYLSLFPAAPSPLLSVYVDYHRGGMECTSNTLRSQHIPETRSRYYFASHNSFVVEGFAAVLMDGRPLPASSERLNERGAVITRLPTLLPEERGRQKVEGGREGGGGQREQELDEEPATDNVLKWEKCQGKE